MKPKTYKAEYWIIFAAIVIKLLFLLIATAHSGYHGDELLHIETGKHLAFGYMDFPPFIGLVSWIQNLFHSDSLYINHLFVYLNAALILFFCGRITLRLGGGILAVLITENALLFSPGFGASQYLFLPTAFEQLFWVLFIYFVVELCLTLNSRYLIYMAVFAALGFLNKYSIVFLFAGFVPAVLLYKRELLSKRTTWLAVLLFIVLILPNVLWQIRNDFPVLHHMSELYKTQLNNQSLVKELATLIVFLNPLTLFIWLAGLLIIPFHPKFKHFHLPAFTLLFAALFLLLSKGKPYYFFPIILSLIAFGAVYLEQMILTRKWIGYSYLFLLSVLGLYLLPHGIPLLKLDKYISSYHLQANTNNKIPLTFENYYAGENWERIFPALSKVYNSLSTEDRHHCYIWGRHYGMAGAVNLMGHRYHLPEAFSFHSSFYTWVPDFNKDVVIIGISEANLGKGHWEQYFNKVEEVAVIENPYASESNWYCYRIFVCRQSKYNSEELKQRFKNEIY